MREPAEEYQKRLAEYVDGQDPLTIQSLTAKKVGRLIREAPVAEQTGVRNLINGPSSKLLLTWLKTSSLVAGGTDR